ncbi:MAG: winged helix-turn-helix transcriptional regulator [Candidatus Bathyarchaeia archaeon]
MEIITSLFKDGKKYVAQLGEELGISYSTAQQRINELEKAGLVNCTNKLHPVFRRPIKEVEIRNFRIVLSPLNIQQIIARERVEEGFKVWTGQKKEDVR